MKLVSFEIDGRAGYGVVKGGGIIDLTKHLPYPSLKALIAANAFSSAEAVLNSAEADFALDSVHLLPVIPDPNKIICVGLNYHDHVQEMGRATTAKPTLFTRFTGTQVAHGDAIIKPLESDQLDYEGELAIVIGKGGRRISEADALSHIAGYACYNDASVRDWQYHTTQFMPGKNFAGTGAFGPWLVSADEIADPTKLSVTTRLNGEVMQHATVDMMINSITAQIAYISTLIPLEAGDVIVTGTPGGIGSKRTPPVWLKDGDVVEVEVSSIGVLRNPIVAEKA